MNLLRLSSLFLAPVLAAGFALACGEISDPTKNAGERTATVSGALTGTNVPPGARVAIVWRNSQAGGVVVGAETDIVGGKFTMNLVAPPDAYFAPMDGEDYDSLNDAPSAVPPPTPVEESGGSSGTDPGGSTSSSSGAPSGGGSTSSSGGAKIAQKVGTRTSVSGGITEPLSIAIAGFIVYVDANGNGKLDLVGSEASSPDTIVGGNKELLLTYLKGGGQLDYEKLRDKSGILPTAGFNLAWDEGRWLPLTLVELKITDNARLARAVCDSDPIATSSGGTDGFNPSSGSSGSSGTGEEPNTATPQPMPAAGDPNVHCFDNGNQFYYTQCPTTPPPPVGLCTSGYGEAAPCAGISYRYDESNPQPGWPCDITGPSGSSSSSSGGGGSTSGSGGPIPVADAGPAPDAGGS